MITSPLSEQAAESIATTFQLLGIQPSQVDLTRVMKAVQVCLSAAMGDSARLKSWVFRTTVNGDSGRS